MSGKDVLVFSAGVLVGWLVLPMILGMVAKKNM